MPGGLLGERVRRDVDVVARAGLPLETFLAEAVESVARAVAWAGACLATHDPGTGLLTGAHKYGTLSDRDTHDHEFGLIEYGTVEPTTFTELAAGPLPAAGVHQLTAGEVQRSGRMSRFMIPHFGFADELRLVAREGSRVWGAIALFRGPEDAPFAPEEIELLGSLSGSFVRGVRAGMLSRLADVSASAPAGGPAVLIVGGDGAVVQTSLGVEDRLDALFPGPRRADAAAVIGSLIGAARRYAQGLVPVPPRARVRAANGMWLVLHASPLSASGDRAGDVVVTIEEARPPEIVSLVVAAFDLTPRERDITQLVLQGVDTKEIASSLHVSAYTVQDHLKSVFDKADVRSRRELISRVYVDQYVPRMGAELGPAGWFSPSAPA